jgi:uncharacterized membrane protein YhiD involved in acid resistance
VNRTQFRSLVGHAAYGLLGVSLGAATTWCSLHCWPGPDVPLWVTGLAAALLAVAVLTVLSGVQARLARPRTGRRRVHARPRPTRKAP